MLLLNANQSVPFDLLTDAIWAANVPRSARDQVQGCISRLRSRIASLGVDPQVIVTEPAGYRAVIDPDDLDLLRFRRLVADARAAASAGQYAQARDAYLAALRLWRGPALADVDSPRVRQAAAALDEEHAQAREARCEVELELGGTGEMVAELTDLVGEYPYRERLHRALMLALYRAGRQADALAAYQRVRRLLHDELGTEPGAELRELHRAILSHDPDLRPPPTAASPEDGSILPVPRELPADVAGFTGRAEALKDLDTMLASSPGGLLGPVVISAITGIAGIGKTALAVHWAHRIVDQFPDGQLFLDLHGYSQGMQPVEPAEALERMLRALGVDGGRIPAGLDERAALFRSRLADQHLLILLDNALTEAQVAPLLPGAPGCVVLVTSRGRLSGLDRTHTLSLEPLPLDDAVALFTRTTGEDRLASEPPQLLAETVELCGRLPLAIRIAAARLRSHPAWSVSHLVERLRHHQHRLAELETGQRSVTGALDLSYQQLNADQQHTYRRLGLHPGPDLDIFAAAALTGRTPAQARQLLDQLHEAHLLQEPSPGRYVFHDLVSAHAAGTAARDESEPTRRAAVTRLFDHYRHTASVMMDVAYPYEHERRPRVPPAATATPDPDNQTQANVWLDTELPNLLTTARHAADHGQPEHTLQLSATLHRHLRTRGRYGDAETLHHQAVTAARSTGHRAGELDALTGLGRVHLVQGRYQEATDNLEKALKIAPSYGYPAKLDALIGLGNIYVLQGQYQQASDNYGQVLETARRTGYRPAEVESLVGLGHVCRMQGGHQRAADNYALALEIARSCSYRTGELEALLGLGWVHQQRGMYQQGTNSYAQALEITRTSGNRPSELFAVIGMGEIDRLQGRYEHATENLGRALEIARAIGHSTAEILATLQLGHIHRAQGQKEQAAGRYQRVLELAGEIGSRNFQFEALYGLGRVRHATGHPDMARISHQHALELATELGQPNDQARAHDGLAHANHALGEREQARQHWQQALEIFIDLSIDHDEYNEVSVPAIRAHLTDLDQLA